MYSSRLVAILATLVAIILPAAALAQTYTWINETPGTQSWHVAANWSPAAVPPAGADVIIPAGSNTVQISTADVTVNSLSVSRPLSIQSSRSLTPGTMTVASTVTMGSSTTLQSGTIDIAGGTLAFSSGSSCTSAARLTNLTINGSVTVATAVNVRWNDVALAGTLTLTTGTNYLRFEGDQTLTGQILNSSTGPLYILSASTGTLTIAGGASVEGGNTYFESGSVGCSGLSQLTLVNSGTVSGSPSRPTSVATPTFFGATAAITGTVQFFNGIDLQGGSWTHASGTVNLQAGATLQNGTIEVIGGSFEFYNSGGACNAMPRLSNLTINGDITLPVSASIRWNNVAHNGAMTFTGNGTSYLLFEGDQLLTGDIVNTWTYFLNIANATSGTVTLASGASISGGNISFISSGYQCSGTGAMTLVNNGTLGGSASRPTYVNTPAQMGPTAVIADRVNFYAPVDLGGSTWTHSDGTMYFHSLSGLQNGTVNIAGGGFEFYNSGGACNAMPRLSNLTINGDFTLLVSASIRWNNVAHNGAMTFTGNGTSYLLLEGDQLLTGDIVNSWTYFLNIANATSGTVTLASGASISGGNISLISSGYQCSGTGAMTLVNNGTLGGSASRPTYVNTPVQMGPTAVIADRVNFYAPVDLGGDTWTHSDGTMYLHSLSGLQNGTVNIAGGTFEFYNSGGACNAMPRLSNLNINGDFTLPVSASIRWNNVAHNGAMTFTGNGTSYLLLEGDQLLTGDIINLANYFLNIANATSGTATLASGASISGGNISLISSGYQCSGTGQLALLNLGTLNGNIPSQQILIFCANINLGSYLGNVNNQNAVPLPSYTTAQPNQSATVPSDRNDPAPSSTTTFTYQNLVVESGTYFGLGPNETLNLNGGTGNLVISQGATFSGNGLIFGNIFNQGLLRIPPTRIATASVTSGGNIVIPVPPSYGAPVVIPSPTPVETHQDTMLSFTGSGGGGWGGGGDGGTAGGSSGSFSSGGGHYVIQSPSVVFQGTTAWDGELEVTGTFEQTDTGFLRLFIAGPEQGETYSLLSVGESATIDGTIQIVLDPILLGFTPNVGDSFDMIIADGGITTAPSLAVQTLITVDGAASLGLELDPFVSPFLMDPDDLVLFPTNIFDMTLVNEGTTLRFTLIQPICSPQPIATTAPSCGRDIADFTVPNAGSGPFAFQWQIEDAPGVDTWSNIEPGFYPDLGTVLTPTERTMSIRKPRFFASGTRFRCIIQNPCDVIITAPVELEVIDQTAEPCGGCPICEADFDDNGGVDGGDLASFFTAFEDGVLCADVDRNGGVDGGDLALFFTLFEDGGCE